MKRPLALIGLTFMLVLTVCFYADFTIVQWLSVFSLVGLLVSVAVRKLRKTVSLPAVFAVSIVAVLVFTLYSQLYVKPIQQKYSGVKALVNATVAEEPQQAGGSYYYTLKTNYINGENVKLKLSLFSNSPINCDVGDSLTFTSELASTDYGIYLSDKVYLRAFTYDGAEVKKADVRPMYYYIVSLRQSIRTALYAQLDYDTAAFATAVLLGDDAGFTEETAESLRHAGLTHIVVVSGLHLAILTMIYTKIFGGLIKNKFVNAACTVLIILFFLCLTGFGKSSIRAAIMLFVLISARLFNREGDSLNSLGLAAILLCTFNPYVVGDVGVLLSFSATFGIVVFSTPLESFLTKRLSPLENSNHKLINRSFRFTSALFSTTVTAVFATLPVNIMFFGKVSLVQIISNLLVLPFVQYFMLFSAFGVIFYYLPIPLVADFFALLAELVGKLILGIAKLLASFPMAYVKADFRFVVFWVFASIALIAFAYALSKKGRGLNLLCITMSIAVLASGASGHMIASRNRLTVYIAPSKYGQGVILAGKDGNAVLSVPDDNYATEKLTSVLDDIYTENQLMIVDFNSKSACNNSEIILSEFDYEQVLMYDKNSNKDYTVTLWDKATFDVFEVNENVYMYLVSADTSMLILPSSGDVLEIPQDLRSPDVLVTSGIIDNMELLSFTTLIANGNSFKQSAVLDFYRSREGVKLAAADTVNFDIEG